MDIRPYIPHPEGMEDMLQQQKHPNSRTRSSFEALTATRSFMHHNSEMYTLLLLGPEGFPCDLTLRKASCAPPDLFGFESTKLKIGPSC